MSNDVGAKDYHDPPPVPLIDTKEFTQWSFYRAIIAEFVATLLFLYVIVLTVIGNASQTDRANGGEVCGGVGILGISWAVGGMIFVLVYCTAGISGECYKNCPLGPLCNIDVSYFLLTRTLFLRFENLWLCFWHRQEGILTPR